MKITLHRHHWLLTACVGVAAVAVIWWRLGRPQADEEPPKARGRITLHSKDVPTTYFDRQ